MDSFEPAPTSDDAPAVLTVEGDLDVASAPELRQRLRIAAASVDRSLVVDLSGVTFIDYGGLKPLLEARSTLADHLQLRAPSAPVLRFLRLAGLTGLFHQVDTEPPAGASVGGAPELAGESGSSATGAAHRRPTLAALGGACVAYLQSRAPLELWLLAAAEEGRQVVIASAGPWSKDLGRGAALPWIGSFALHMAAGSAPALAPRTADVPIYARASAGRWAAVKGYLGVAVVRDDGELVATLSGFSEHPDHPSVTDTVALLDLMRTSLATTANLENAYHLTLEALDRAYFLAETDALTDLLNRRGWLSALARETERCARYGTPASIVSLDLDNLKVVNDAHGHQAGDSLLEATARVLTRACRPNDVVARTGGDEFAVLAVEVDDATVGGLTGRIEEELRTAGVSASTGGASRAAGEDLVDAWARADRAMYAHKRARAAARAPRS